MTAQEFARRRGRIFLARRSSRWLRRALKNLELEAGAKPVRYSGRLIGHQMPCGQFLCVKRRYKTEALALDALETCKSAPLEYRRERRAYQCDRCGGWHLTSKTDPI